MPWKNEKVWLIPERTLPVPSAASGELQRLLGRISQPNVEKALKYTPHKKEEWLEIAQNQREMSEPYTLDYAKHSGVTIEARTIAGVTCYQLTPPRTDPRHTKHLFVYIHGGAYVFGGGKGGLSEAITIAKRVEIPVLSIDYRTAPTHPFPAALEDVVSVYQELLKSHPAQTIALGGTSSGGGLTLAVVHRLKKLGLPLPAALYAGTPWSDLSKTGDSYFINEGIDHKLITYGGTLKATAELYANGKNLKDPLLSPVYGDFSDFPPTYLVTGTRDLFLSNTLRVHRKLREKDRVADLNVYEGFSHVEYLVLPDSPEAKEMYRELDLFLLRHLAAPKK
jgi:acetyl esterase/lipase